MAFHLLKIDFLDCLRALVCFVYLPLGIMLSVQSADIDVTNKIQRVKRKFELQTGYKSKSTHFFVDSQTKFYKIQLECTFISV